MNICLIVIYLKMLAETFDYHCGHTGNTGNNNNNIPFGFHLYTATNWIMNESNTFKKMIFLSLNNNHNVNNPTTRSFIIGTKSTE